MKTEEQAVAEEREKSSEYLSPSFKFDEKEFTTVQEETAFMVEVLRGDKVCYYAQSSQIT